MLTLLAFLPILVLLVLSLVRGVRTGVFAGFGVASILFFVFLDDVAVYFASLFSALIGTVNIMMIIFGAVFLYQVMDQKGYINRINESLTNIHPERSFRFYFLAVFLTAFFEGVAGFGTPGAIVPLLLISMGYNAIVSISVVLLLDGVFAMGGAVGIPVTAGLQLPLSLSVNDATFIYTYAAIFMIISGLIIAYAIVRLLKKNSQEKATGRYLWIIYFLIMIPLVLLAGLLKELAVIVSALILVVLSVVLLFKNKKIKIEPWVPYLVLIGILLIPKLFSSLGPVLSYELKFEAILGTDISGQLQPLKSPLIPFLVASIFALFKSGSFNVDFKPIISKTIAVFIILLPSLAITQLMLNSGGKQDSMIDLISGFFILTGEGYPFISPLIGVLGAFISGSTTVSNVIFGPLQYNAAQSLDFNSNVILSMQLVGASMGNAICLFNIIAAAAVAGVKDYSEILRNNIYPVLIAAIICSLCGYTLIYLL